MLFVVVDWLETTIYIEIFIKLSLIFLIIYNNNIIIKMNNKPYISVITVLILVIIYLLFEINNKKIVYNQKIVTDTTYVYLPADTIKLKEIQTHRIFIDREINNIDSIAELKYLTKQIDSLNNELTKQNITRIAEIDTIINPYSDRINIQYLINKDLWNINMYYNEREIKVAEKVIYLKEEKNLSDLEKVINQNPYLSIFLSGIIGYGVGRAFQ